MNPCLMLARNNIDLTKKAVKSVYAQDVPVELLLIDNASTDGTSEWARTQMEMGTMYFDPPKSVAESWNIGLKFFFDAGAEYVLVVNNDIELRPDTYRHLIADGGLFVTAIGMRDRERIMPPYLDPDPANRRNHPDFSCYLIRRETYEKVGEFDEAFRVGFCEDGDMDLRMYKSGIRAYALELMFLHHGSMTIKNADPAEVRRIQIQADKNREYFKLKWGFAMASPEYYRALDKGGPE